MVCYGLYILLLNLIYHYNSYSFKLLQCIQIFVSYDKEGLHNLNAHADSKVTSKTHYEDTDAEEDKILPYYNFDEHICGCALNKP